jgi:hypothetical protein
MGARILCRTSVVGRASHVSWIFGRNLLIFISVIERGSVGGEAFAVDASLIQADTSDRTRRFARTATTAAAEISAQEPA